jgi:hypothetical protein
VNRCVGGNRAPGLGKGGGGDGQWASSKGPARIGGFAAVDKRLANIRVLSFLT